MKERANRALGPRVVRRFVASPMRHMTQLWSLI
jgi:hypothetical protein